MFQISNSFEEYTLFSEIGVHFFQMNVHFSRFRPFAMPGSHHLSDILVWPFVIRDA